MLNILWFQQIIEDFRFSMVAVLPITPDNQELTVCRKTSDVPTTAVEDLYKLYTMRIKMFHYLQVNSIIN